MHIRIGKVTPVYLFEFTILFSVHPVSTAIFSPSLAEFQATSKCKKRYCVKVKTGSRSSMLYPAFFKISGTANIGACIGSAALRF